MERPQSEFPLMDEYKKYFQITEKTIFALYPNIYTNYKLTPDLLIHERTHLKQQQEYGIEKWVEDYLNDSQFRLIQEIEAYTNQINSVKDGNAKLRMRIWASETLSSSLYGNIINYEVAYELLK